MSTMATASAAEETSYGLSEPETLISFLEDAGIRLVRLEYLIELRESGKPLPRRQEAEQEKTSLGLPALVESSELQEVEIDPNTAHMSVMIRHPEPRRVKVHLVSISHMWESREHPDPWRFGVGRTWEGFRQGILERGIELSCGGRSANQMVISFAPTPRPLLVVFFCEVPAGCHRGGVPSPTAGVCRLDILRLRFLASILQNRGSGAALSASPSRHVCHVLPRRRGSPSDRDADSGERAGKVRCSKRTQDLRLLEGRTEDDGRAHLQTQAKRNALRETRLVPVREGVVILAHLDEGRESGAASASHVPGTAAAPRTYAPRRLGRGLRAPGEGLPPEGRVHDQAPHRKPAW